MASILRFAPVLLAVVAPGAWGQEAAEVEDKEISLAFWIAIAVPIGLAVAFAIRAASSKKKF